MAKFSYRMQNILDIKYKMEEQAKSSFAAAMARLRTEKNKLDAMFARKKNLKKITAIKHRDRLMYLICQMAEKQ